MVTGKTEAFATRIPAKQAEQVVEAVEQTDWSRATLLERALRYYIDENPDDLRAFKDGNHQDGLLEKAGILPKEADEDSPHRRDRVDQRTK